MTEKKAELDGATPRPYVVEEYAPQCYGVRVPDSYVIDIKDHALAIFWADRLNEAFARGLNAVAKSVPGEE